MHNSFERTGQLSRRLFRKTVSIGLNNQNKTNRKKKALEANIKLLAGKYSLIEAHVLGVN